MKVHSKERCPNCMRDYLIVVPASLYTCDGDEVETNALQCPACGYIEYPFYELGFTSLFLEN